LKPEKMDAFEVSADWTRGRTVHRLTAFTFDIDNQIGRFRTYRTGDVPAVTLEEIRPLPTTPVVPTPGYANGPGLRVSGVEAESRGALWSGRLFWTVSAGWKDGRDDATKRNIEYLDRWLAHTDLTLRTGRVTNTVSADYVGRRRGHVDDDPSYAVTPGLTKGQTVAVPSWTRVSYKGILRLSSGWDVSIAVINAFKDSVRYPEFIRRRLGTIPGDGDRRYYAGTSVVF